MAETRCFRVCNIFYRAIKPTDVYAPFYTVAFSTRVERFFFGSPRRVREYDRFGIFVVSKIGVFVVEAADDFRVRRVRRKNETKKKKKTSFELWT